MIQNMFGKTHNKISTIVRKSIAFMLSCMLVVGLVLTEPLESNAAEQGMPTIVYSVHSQSYGWMNPVFGGNVTGTTGQSKRLEAITISVNTKGLKASDGSALTGGIAYRAHVQSYGWMNWVTSEANGESTNSLINRNVYAGTVGKGKRLEAICMELTGKLAEEYDIFYRVHVQSYGWQNWTRNGAVAGTVGKGKRLEAIQIKLVKKVVNVSASLSYSVHSQSYGWMNEINVSPSQVSNSTIAGTTGQSKRLEAIKLRINTTGVSGGITYSTHVQSHGWQNYVSDGAVSGTTGQHKRIEAIKINLTGDISAYYDVYYRVHSQDYGWLDWAKNGEPAGTENGSKRMEAIQIVLVEKGGAAPGATTRPYVKISTTNWQDIPGALEIRVNKQMNCVTIYKGGVAIKAMVCSTGAATPLGTYYIKTQWRWHELMNEVYGQYCSQIVGDILFHSVPYNSPNIYDLSAYMYNQLGTQCSHGCIRLTVADAKWIYDNCDWGTTVVIYNDSNPGPLGKPSAQQIPYSQTWDPTDPAIK